MIITRTILRDWGACYSDDRIAALFPPDGLTLRQILDLPIPAEDRIWVAVRALPAAEARLFAVRCARRALSRVASPDPRSFAACDVAERFARGEATVEEMRTARAAAINAAAAAHAAHTAGAAAGAATYATYAATYAAGAATYATYAATYAADATYAATYAADAADAATYAADATYAATYAADAADADAADAADAAYATERRSQIADLIQVCE